MDTQPLNVHKTGLNIVYDPGPGNAEAECVQLLQHIFVDEADTDYSIVFVHGLQGHPYNTWACPRPPPGRLKKKKPKVWHRLAGARNPLEPNPEPVATEDIAKSSQMIYWPVDLLATECTDVRVLSWGYDTVVTQGYEAATKNSIFAHAKNLLAALEREQVAGRPLIFVAHSLGGIVVKEVRSDYNLVDDLHTLISEGPSTLGC